MNIKLKTGNFIASSRTNFFQSYLSSRKQFTLVNGETSTATLIKYGVPQGSILGPLLFLLYINDLPSATSFFIKLFADDTSYAPKTKISKPLKMMLIQNYKKFMNG